MTETRFNRQLLDWTTFRALCRRLAEQIDWRKYVAIYPVLRGGVYPAIELSTFSGLPIIWELSEGALVVDEIHDSGATLATYQARGYDVAVLHYKRRPKCPTYFATETSDWIVYPWEDSSDITKTITRQIEFFGDLPTRKELVGTPDRVVNSWELLYAGYSETASEILVDRYEASCRAAKAPILVRDIEFVSMCEQHMLPFWGVLSLGYIPRNEEIDISNLIRLVDHFARRLQSQERMCEEIADAIEIALNPIGVLVRAAARHMYVISIIVDAQFEEMETVASRGRWEEIGRLLSK